MEIVNCGKLSINSSVFSPILVECAKVGLAHFRTIVGGAQLAHHRPIKLNGLTESKSSESNLERGYLFVFEGPDDVGKTTLATKLSEGLTESGTDHKVLSFPGRESGTVGEFIYRFYHDPLSFGVAQVSPITMQVLVTAAHIEVIESRLKPLLRAGTNIILDRFWWSTWVYASVAGVSERTRDLLIDLELRSWEGINPDFIFLISRNAPLGTKPVPSEWSTLASLYGRLAELEAPNANVSIITNNGSLHEAIDAITVSISKVIPGIRANFT